MKKRKLLLTPFRNAVSSLEKALEVNPIDELARDATIKRFEYCFELAWKMMKRVLEVDYNMAEADRLTKKDLFRQAYEVGLIDAPEKWFQYLEDRNKTSHEYSEEVAETVYETAKKFFPDVKNLLAELTKRHERHD